MHHNLLVTGAEEMRLQPCVNSLPKSQGAFASTPCRENTSRTHTRTPPRTICRRARSGLRITLRVFTVTTSAIAAVQKMELDRHTVGVTTGEEVNKKKTQRNLI